MVISRQPLLEQYTSKIDVGEFSNVAIDQILMWVRPYLTNKCTVIYCWYYWRPPGVGSGSLIDTIMNTMGSFLDIKWQNPWLSQTQPWSIYLSNVSVVKSIWQPCLIQIAVEIEAPEISMEPPLWHPKSNYFLGSIDVFLSQMLPLWAKLALFSGIYSVYLVLRCTLCTSQLDGCVPLDIPFNGRKVVHALRNLAVINVEVMVEKSL